MNISCILNCDAAREVFQVECDTGTKIFKFKESIKVARQDILSQIVVWQIVLLKVWREREDPDGCGLDVQDIKQFCDTVKRTTASLRPHVQLDEDQTSLSSGPEEGPWKGMWQKEGVRFQVLQPQEFCGDYEWSEQQRVDILVLVPDPSVDMFVIPWKETLVDVSESSKVFRTDGLVDIGSKVLKEIRTATKAGFHPDLLVQDVFITQDVHDHIDSFLESPTSRVGVLNGPKGCGKTRSLLNVANNKTIVYVNPMEQAVKVGQVDVSLYRLKMYLAKATSKWTKRNESYQEVDRIVLAFLLSRIFYKRMMEKSRRRSKYGPVENVEFLYSQLFNSRSITHSFKELLKWDLETLKLVFEEFGEWEGVWCIDDGHLLRDYLGSRVVTEQKGDLYKPDGQAHDWAKRGVLSLLLRGMLTHFPQSKVLIAGTALNADQISDIFKQEQSLCQILPSFQTWTQGEASAYVESILDVDSSLIDALPLGNKFPLVLETFIYNSLGYVTESSYNSRYCYIDEDEASDEPPSHNPFWEKHKRLDDLARSPTLDERLRQYLQLAIDELSAD
jgi:hypothetical protein